MNLETVAALLSALFQKVSSGCNRIQKGPWCWDRRVDASGLAYPFTFEARDQTEFTSDFETTWNLLLSNPDQPSLLGNYNLI